MSNQQRGIVLVDRRPSALDHENVQHEMNIPESPSEAIIYNNLPSSTDDANKDRPKMITTFECSSWSQLQTKSTGFVLKWD